MADITRTDVIRAYYAALGIGGVTADAEPGGVLEAIVDEAMAEDHELQSCEAEGVIERLRRLSQDLDEMAYLLEQDSLL